GWGVRAAAWRVGAVLGDHLREQGLRDRSDDCASSGVAARGAGEGTCWGRGCTCGESEGGERGARAGGGGEWCAVGHDAALVIGGAPAIEPAAALGGSNAGESHFSAR